MIAVNLLSRLYSTEWFAHVGKTIVQPRCRIVDNWSEAFRYSGDEVTQWCRLEASLRLYNHLAECNYERFRMWNEIARSFASSIDQLLAKAMAVPGIPEFPPHAQSHLRSQLIGALMEEAFDDVLRVTLCREQIDLLEAGHFPCGWEVSSAEAFPDKAILLVY